MNASQKPHVLCAPSELSYNQKLLFQADIDYTYEAQILPKNTILAGNPISFHLESGEDFLDLSRTVLTVEILTTDDAGEGINALTEDVALINNTLSSLFSGATISLRDTVISHSDQNYAYRSYLENLLNFSTATKRNRLKKSGFVMDKATLFDDKTNPGFRARRASVKGGRLLELSGRLHLDVVFQQLLIPNHVDVNINLTPSRQQFVVQSFMADNSFNVQIVSAKLSVTKAKLFPNKAVEFENFIAREPIRLPIKFVKVQTVSIPQGLTSFARNNIFTGELPDTLICGIVTNESYAGSWATNPFNFAHFNLSSIQCRINGRSVPTHAIQPNFADGNFTGAYESLFKALGTDLEDWDNGIDQDLFSGGCALYGFSFGAGTICPHDLANLHGSIDLEISFSTALPKTVSLVLYSQAPSTIIIDKHRNVLVEL